ncbi:hypothetical protein B1M_17130 [Burkholderia sp. TJI49]|nr:hypothetical protein B1M_17130 [Burkholderia sp. TJI49]
MSFCVIDDASWQAGDCFPHAARVGIGDHGEHDGGAACDAV